MASKVGALFVALGLDDAQYRAGMSGAVGTAKKSTALIQTNFSTLNFRTFLYGMAGVYAVKAAIEGIMSPAINFQAQMSQVSTMLDKSAMDIMPKYTAGIQDMQKAYGQSSEALTKGLYDILSATIEPAKAMGVLEAANKAATAGITDTATATTGIVTILKAYQMDASKAADVSDLLFATVKRGRTTFAELAPSIGVVASSAAQAGLKVEELGAMLAVMTRAGLSTDMAVIAMANMLNSFIKPTGPAIKAAKELGLELNTTTLRTMGMVGVMDVLSRATETQTAAIFGNIRGLRGINAAMSDTIGFTQDLSIMANRAGLTMEAFNKQYNTAKETLKRLGQTLLVDVAQPATTALIPAILSAAGAIKTWTEANRQFLKVKVPEYVRSLVDSFKDLVAVVNVLYKPLNLLFKTIVDIAMLGAVASLGMALTKLGAVLVAITPALTAFQFALNLGIGGAFVASVITIYQVLKSYSNVMKENKKDLQDWRIELERLTTTSKTIYNEMGPFQPGKNKFYDVRVPTDVTITKGYKARRESLDAMVKLQAEQNKSLEQTYDVLNGINTISEYGLTLEAAKLRVLQTYTATVRPTGPTKGMFDYGFTDEQIKSGDAKLKAQADLTSRYGEHYRKFLADYEAVQQSGADHELQITRDTQMSKLQFTKSGTALLIAQEELRLQYYKEDLEKEYAGYAGLQELKIAAEQQSVDIIKLIQINAQQEAAERSTQAWEGFKDHFSNILARMVQEGDYSAKAIGRAFADTFRRIAIEKASAYAVGAVFDFMFPAGGAMRSLLTMGSGGMVYKPSFALVGESGPERVLNPAETRAYNSNTDDHSSVSIHIHADTDTLRNLNPYKFAELYKEAKRSQLLAG
jgi:TP901 family phage tail tape measure protein